MPGPFTLFVIWVVFRFLQAREVVREWVFHVKHFRARRRSQRRVMDDFPGTVVRRGSIFLVEGYEWYCTASGLSKQQITKNGCSHAGPCPMATRPTLDFRGARAPSAPSRRG